MASKGKTSLLGKLKAAAEEPKWKTPPWHERITDEAVKRELGELRAAYQAKDETVRRRTMSYLHKFCKQELGITCNYQAFCAWIKGETT